MTTRADLHSIVDDLPETELDTARAYLEKLRKDVAQDDPVKAFLLSAPLDDEPYTDDQRRAVEASRARDRNDRPISWAQLEQTLGDG